MQLLASTSASILHPGRPYQVEELDEHWDTQYRLDAWEQGTGKTWEAVAKGIVLFERGMIDGMLVLAPKGVHYNWVDTELPKHCGVSYVAHGFDNDKDTSKNKAHAEALAAVLAIPKSRMLTILTVGYPALLKDSMACLVPRKALPDDVSGRLADYCRSRRVLIIGDELRKIKDHEGEISRRAVALSHLCPYRLGLDGTPIDNGAIDVYAEMLFLDRRFWARHGIGSMTAFKSKFCNLIPATGKTLYTKDGDGNAVPRMRWNPETRQREPAQAMRILSYKNLDQLYEILRPYVSRVTKESAGLNLPPKTYVYQPFDLTPTQRKVYEKMHKEYHVFLDGNLITADLALTRLTRLMQIASGYLPTDVDGEELVEIDPGRNPRLDALVALTEPMTTQAMIWAAYRPDRDRILDALGDRIVCYHSSDSDDQKRAAIAAWQRGDYQFILGHVKSGLSSGHTLTNAHVAIYYSNLYFHADRLQSEDRIHRIGQTLPCTYYDLVARNTVDKKAVLSLIAKAAIAAQVLGDSPRDWLRPM